MNMHKTSRASSTSERPALTTLASTLLGLGALTSLAPAATVATDIVYHGTAEQRQEMEDALQALRDASPAAEAALSAAEAHGKAVHIYPAAVDPQGHKVTMGHVYPKSSGVVAERDHTYVDLTDMGRTTLVGAGAAQTKSGLGYVLYHEIIGHWFNEQQGNPSGEPAARAATNAVRTQISGVTRTADHQIIGGKVLIPFSDGSKLDVTDAVRQAAAPGGFVNALAALQAVGPLVIPGTNHFSLDLLQPAGISIMLPAEVGAGIVNLPISGLDLTVDIKPIGTSLALEITDFHLDFGSYDYGGSPTGANTMGLTFQRHKTPNGLLGGDGMGQIAGTLSIASPFFNSPDGVLVPFEAQFALDPFSGQASIAMEGLPIFPSGVGLPYCTSAPNSTGWPSEISATGSHSLAVGGVRLRASNAPPGQPGIFFFGDLPIQVPFGNGTLCAGGSIQRLPVIFESAGSLSYTVDWGTYGGLFTTAASTYFQCWYRDPAAGGAAFNTSDGLAVLFLP